MESHTGAADLIRLGATDLAALIRERQVSAREVVDAYIDRIERVNGRLNAVVIPLFDEARTRALEADREAARPGAGLGPLHGVPVTIKEQYRVAGTQTTLGASRKAGNVYQDEGPLVTGLRKAGAIILGKTNIMQTLAGWESDNPVYGRSNNPWNPDRTPGGSSGGEAAIVAAGGSALGLAGDYGGSIRLPAHFCGVHGFKPTAGRLSNTDFATGLLGVGQELLIPQPGPIARTVADIRLAMSVFAATSIVPTGDLAPPVPWTDPDRVSIEGLRVGYYTDNGYYSPSPSVRRAVEDAARALEHLGATVEELEPPNPEKAVRLFLRAGSAGGGTDYFRLLDGEKPVAQVAGWLRGIRLPGPMQPIVARIMRMRGQEHLAGQIEHLRPCSAEDYFDLVEARNAYRSVFTRQFEQRGFDALICPPVALPAFTHGSSEHLFPAVTYAFTYNVLGAPAGVVATTRVRSGEESDRQHSKDLADIAGIEVEQGSVGLPLGVQVVARHWNDHVAIAVMGALEGYFRSTPDYPHPVDMMD